MDSIVAVVASVTTFDDRIGQPTFENILVALSDPALAPFVRIVNPTANADDRAAVQAILDLPTTGLRDAFPATSYGAIVDAVAVVDALPARP